MNQNAALTTELRERFEYEALEGDQIRLLQLQPRQRKYSNTWTYSGKLITATLQPCADAPVPHYNALSYTWGNDPPNREMLLEDSHGEDKRFRVKPNLDRILRCLSQAEDQQLLWVDAICINQEDVEERNKQVGMMQLIYQQAQIVLVSIGDGEVTPHPVFHTKIITEFLRDFADDQRRGARYDTLLRNIESPPYDIESPLRFRSELMQSGHWSELIKFFDQAWWRRVWVRQEIALSKRAVVLYGDKRVDWTDVQAVCHWIAVWIANLDSKTICYGGRHRSGVYSGEDMEYFRQSLDTTGALDFRNMLLHARNCEATDPRDKVYAILGIVDNNTSTITVDYSLSLSEVAKLAFKKIVFDRGGSLEALIFSQNPAREQSIPSWAPNLCSPFNARPSRMEDSHRRSSRYSVGSIYNAPGDGVWWDKPVFAEDGKTLSVDGFIFDTIETQSRTCENSDPLLPMDIEATIREWRTLVFAWLGRRPIEEKYEELMRTLTADKDIRGQRLPSRESQDKKSIDWRTFFRIEHLGAGAVTEFEHFALAMRKSVSEGGLPDQAEVDAWLRLCEQNIRKRRIIKTSGGNIALVPAESEVGDVFCVIMGLDVPVVLRKLESDSYVLVGETFCNGAMDGEKIPEHIPFSKETLPKRIHLE